MFNKTTRRKNTKIVKLYLDVRHTFWSGFQPYYFFRRRIEFVLGNSDKRIVRSIFNNLLSNDIIQKKILYRKVLYIYNPNNLPHEYIFDKITTIEFND